MMGGRESAPRVSRNSCYPLGSPCFEPPFPMWKTLRRVFYTRQRGRNRCKCTLRRPSLCLSLSLSLSSSISHPGVFFCTRLGGIPSRRLGKGPVGLVRLTRVLFDYYFGTYRALVTSLCGHMVVGG